jgi:hypothetical protein
MGKYLEMLKSIDSDEFTFTPENELPLLPEVPFGSNGSRDRGFNEKNGENLEGQWWLLHYAGAESEQVCTWPPSTHCEILKDNPKAIAAEPIAVFAEDYYEKVKSDPYIFYEHCIKGCFEFKVEQGRLFVTPAEWIDEEMNMLIQKHSNVLILIVLKKSETNKVNTVTI